MEKINGYSAMLISFSVILIGCMIVINNNDTFEFFYNFASVLFLLSCLGFTVSGILLIERMISDKI